MSKDTTEVKVLTSKEEQDLINFVNDIPTKFGLPLLQFLKNLKSIKVESKKLNGTD